MKQIYCPDCHEFYSCLERPVPDVPEASDLICANCKFIVATIRTVPDAPMLDPNWTDISLWTNIHYYPNQLPDGDLDPKPADNPGGRT